MPFNFAVERAYACVCISWVSDSMFFKWTWAKASCSLTQWKCLFFVFLRVYREFIQPMLKIEAAKVLLPIIATACGGRLRNWETRWDVPQRQKLRKRWLTEMWIYSGRFLSPSGDSGERISKSLTSGAQGGRSSKTAKFSFHICWIIQRPAEMK